MFHKPDLEQVHGDVCLTVPVLRFLAEEQRGDVFTAAEKKTIAEPDIFIDHVVAADERQDHRKPFGVPYRLDIRVSDELAVLCKTADNNTDPWFHIYSF